MSTEIEPANASLEVPKRNTWNIIFIAVDINSRYENASFNLANYDKYDAIQLGISNFWSDVVASKFSGNVTISILQYLSHTPSISGKLALYSSASKSSDKGTFEMIEDEDRSFLKGVNFDCHSDDSFAAYFNYIKAKYSFQKPQQKFLIIFLAHSFGAGFLYYELTNRYFTTIQFSDAIAATFEKIDCLLSVNCTLQSIESNCILRNTAKFLIGSQQQMYVETITYKRLLFDLSYYSLKDGYRDFVNSSFDDEQIFTKFILNCHDTYLRSKEKAESLMPFCLTLTRPEKAKYLMVYLNVFSLSLDLKKNGIDIKNVRFAKKFCEDPSSSDIINIIDAKQFFQKLKNYIDPSQDGILKSINYILLSLKNLICFHLASGNCCEEEEFYGDNLSIYMPSGLGIFLEQLDSANGREILKINDKLYRMNPNQGDKIFRLDFADWSYVADGTFESKSILDRVINTQNFTVTYKDKKGKMEKYKSKIAKMFKTQAKSK